MSALGVQRSRLINRLDCQTSLSARIERKGLFRGLSNHKRAPQKVTTWVREFASRFHSFYRECRVLTDDDELTQARLWLVEASRIGLSSALGLLGVSAPESMARLEGADDDEPETS